MRVAFANAKATHIFSAKKFRVNAIFNNQSFNDTLTNDIVGFEQLGPDAWSVCIQITISQIHISLKVNSNS